MALGQVRCYYGQLDGWTTRPQFTPFTTLMCGALEKLLQIPGNHNTIFDKRKEQIRK